MVAGLIPALISRLSQKYPRLSFDVILAQPGLAQYRALRDREFELLVGRIPRAFADDDINVEILYDEPLVVAVGAKNRWLRQRKIELSELIDEPWVLPHADSVPGQLIAEVFRAAGLNVPAATVIASSLQMNDALLANGQYLAFYPGSVLRLAGKQPMIKVLPVKLPALRTPVGIATLKNRVISPIAQLFIDCARDMTRSLDLGSPAR